MAVIVSTISQLHILRSKKEIIRQYCIHMLASKTSFWVVWIQQKSATDSQTYCLFCAFLRMFTGIDVTGAGGLGTVKNDPGVACSVDSGKAVIHLSCLFFIINRTYEGKLKAYEVRTLKTYYKSSQFKVPFYMVQLYRSSLKLKVTPEEESFGSDLPSRPDFLSYQTPSCENFQFAIRRGRGGGVDFFWNKPILPA